MDADTQTRRAFQTRSADKISARRLPQALPSPPFDWLPSLLQPLTGLPGLLASTAAYITVFVLLRAYTRRPSSYPLPPISRTVITWNSRLYSLFCVLYLICLVATISPFDADVDEVLRTIYHLTKIWEYVDVPNVLLTASTSRLQPIDLHFFIHHLTTPYLTYFRVLPSPPSSYGWRIFAGLNKAHHALMYAYFGGLWGRTDDWGRVVLQTTGTVQLVGGLAGDLFVLWMRNYLRFDWDEGGIGGENWRNYVAIGILGTYLVLNIRDMRLKSAERKRLENEKVE